MSDINWDLAPNTVTHYSPENSSFKACWVVKNQDDLYQFVTEDEFKRNDYNATWLKGTFDDDKLIPRNTDKPIYTAAMCEAGELPPIGLLIQIRRDYKDDNQFYNGVLVCENKGVIWFDDDKYGGCLHSLNEVTLRPIDTRTDEEKAADDFIENRQYTAIGDELVRAIFLAGTTWSKS